MYASFALEYRINTPSRWLQLLRCCAFLPADLATVDTQLGKIFPYILRIKIWIQVKKGNCVVFWACPRCMSQGWLGVNISSQSKPNCRDSTFPSLCLSPFLERKVRHQLVALHTFKPYHTVLTNLFVHNTSSIRILQYKLELSRTAHAFTLCFLWYSFTHCKIVKQPLPCTEYRKK